MISASLLLLANAGQQPQRFVLPAAGTGWRVLLDTAEPAGVSEPMPTINLAGRSLVVLETT